MKDEITFEERKRRYIESVEAEHIPPEKSYWQHPAPTYHPTADYAIQFPHTINTTEPVEFKAAGRQRMVATVMLIVAGTLIYLIAEKNFGFTQLVFLMLLLLVALPFLLNNKSRIVINHESIWLYKDDTNISWKNVLVTYIKQAQQEHTVYFFIVHYYDEVADEFKKIEMELDGLILPAILSATVEAFKQEGMGNR